MYIFLLTIWAFIGLPAYSGKLDGQDAFFFKVPNLHESCQFFRSQGFSSLAKLKESLQKESLQKKSTLEKQNKNKLPSSQPFVSQPLNCSKHIPSLKREDLQIADPKNEKQEGNKRSLIQSFADVQKEKADSHLLKTENLTEKQKTFVHQIQQTDFKNKILSSEEKNEIREIFSTFQAMLDRMSDFEGKNIFEQIQNAQSLKEKLKISQNQIVENSQNLQQIKAQKEALVQNLKKCQEDQYLLEQEHENLKEEKKQLENKLLEAENQKMKAISESRVRERVVENRQAIDSVHNRLRILDGERNLLAQKCIDLEKEVQRLKRPEIQTTSVYTQTKTSCVETTHVDARKISDLLRKIEKNQKLAEEILLEKEKYWHEKKKEYIKTIENLENLQKKAHLQISENAENLEHAIDQIASELSLFSGKDLFTQMIRFKESIQNEKNLWIDDKKNLKKQMSYTRGLIDISATLPEATDRLKKALSSVKGKNLLEKAENCIKDKERLEVQIQELEFKIALNEEEHSAVQKIIDQDSSSLKNAVNNLEDLLRTFVGKDLLQKTENVLKNTKDLVEQLMTLELFAQGKKNLIDPNAETEEAAFQKLKLELFDFGSGGFVHQVQEAKSQIQDLKTQIKVLDQIIKSAKNLINPCASTLSDAIIHAQKKLSKFGSESLIERVLKVLQDLEDLQKIKDNLAEEILRIQTKIDPHGRQADISIEKAKNLLKEFGIENPLISQIQKAVHHIDHLNSKIQSYDEARRDEELQRIKKEEKFTKMLEKIEAYEKNTFEKLGLNVLGGSGTWEDRIQTIHKKIDDKGEENILNSVSALMDNRLFSLGDIHAGNGSIRNIVQVMKKKGLDTQGIDYNRVDLSCTVRNMILAFQKLSQGSGQKGEKSALAVWNNAQNRYVPVDLRIDCTLSNIILRLLENYEPDHLGGSKDIIVE